MSDAPIERAVCRECVTLTSPILFQIAAVGAILWSSMAKRNIIISRTEKQMKTHLIFEKSSVKIKTTPKEARVKKNTSQMAPKMSQRRLYKIERIKPQL